MRINKILIFSLALSAMLTACDTPSADTQTSDNDKAEIVSETTTATSAENISTGYIITADSQEYTELHQNPEDENVIARMYYGEPVTVYSINSEWADISYGGMRGYVQLSYISFNKPEAKTEAATEEKTDIAAESVQQTEAQPVQNIQQNVQIVFYADNDGIEVAEPAYYPSYVANNGTAAWCSAQSIYIYSQPSTNSYKREANMLYYGDVCQILGSVDDWYYISTDSGSGYDLHGYVKQNYITIGAAPVAPEPVNATHGVVNVGSANVRSSPDKSNNSNVLFSLSQGAEFDVISYDGYWYKINYNGTVCYISHKMVDVW
jgi:hypothetical protein